MAPPRSINIVSLFFYLAFFAFAYGTYQYLPKYWKKHELQALVKEQTYAARRKSRDDFIETLREKANKKLGIQLAEEDIEYVREEDTIFIKVNWHFMVHHPFGKKTKHTFTVKQETFYQ